MSKKRHVSATSTLLRALRVIRGKGCHNVTTPGHGHCFRFGRTIGAKYGADRACDACIADRALNRAAAFNTPSPATLAALYRENTSDAANLLLQFMWPDNKPWPASVRACKGERAGYACKLYRPASDTDKSVF